MSQGIHQIGMHLGQLSFTQPGPRSESSLFYESFGF
jgi:hypothetical protein